MLNAPRKHPSVPRDSTSPTPRGVSKGPLSDGARDSPSQIVVPSDLTMPALTPKLYDFISDLGDREDKVFHFSFSAHVKDKAIDILELLKASYSLKHHGCYISKGCFWEQCMKVGCEELNWIVTVKIRKPSDVTLNLICEYALSQNFTEVAVYSVPWRTLTVIRCEYKLK